MFRNYDLRFLIPYVVLLLALTGLIIWYEVVYVTEDSWPDTIKAIGEGMSSSVSATFTIFATVEGTAYMVLALMRLRRLREEEEEKRKQWREEGLREGREEGREEGLREGREEGREEERQRWQAWWLRQAEEMRAAGLSFDEQPPGPEQNGTSSGPPC